MAYSDAAKFASEAIGTCIAIYLGESIIANEVLAATKGKAMGWGFVALGFGMAFGVAIIMLGYISAHLNPASTLAKLILGKIGGVEFVAAVCGEFLGAFVAGVLVWLHYLPHFKTVPEPLSLDADELLLRTRDAMTPTALGIASYNTRADDVAARKRGFGDVTRAVQDVGYYLRDTHRVVEPADHAALVEVALGPTELKRGDTIVEGAPRRVLRRRSVQVADVHRRLKAMDLDEYKAMLLRTSVAPPVPNGVQTSISGALDTEDEKRTRSTAGALEGGAQAVAAGAPPPHSAASIAIGPLRPEHPAPGAGEGMAAASPAAPSAEHPAVDNRGKRLDKLYDAAVVADQNAKLSIFCTRPAIYSPPLNLLCEVMCTTALVYGALMIDARGDQLHAPERALFVALSGLLVGFFVFLCILALGGPTGIAANPARDFSPRLAHWVLPIPGKGPSEFYYAWIPIVGPFIGGCAAAGLYAATQRLNHTNADAPTLANLGGAPGP